MAGSAAAVAKTWGGFPDDVKEHIIEYLDITPLMPPERLRWSRALGRPMMHTLYPREWVHSRRHQDPRGHVYAGDLIGCVYTDEVLRLHCAVWGRRWDDVEAIEWVIVNTGDLAPTGAPVRDQLFEAHIIDTHWADDAFAVAWFRRYGEPWPGINTDYNHPCLDDIVSNYHYGFCFDWSDHAQACEFAIWTRWDEAHPRPPSPPPVAYSSDSDF